MNGATFGALAAARTLLDAGFEGRQAEAIAGVVRDSRAGLATKADLDNLEARMESRIASLETRLTRLIARMDGGLIVLGTAISALIVAAVAIIKFL